MSERQREATVSESISEDEAEERLEVEANRSGSVFVNVPRAVIGALDDLRTIAQSVVYIPELARSLGVIESKVESLDDEVRRMRVAVESMQGDVGSVSHSVKPLETTLEELEKSIHPLRRATGRLGFGARRGSAVEAVDQPPADPAAPTGT